MAKVYQPYDENKAKAYLLANPEHSIAALCRALDISPNKTNYANIRALQSTDIEVPVSKEIPVPTKPKYENPVKFGNPPDEPKTDESTSVSGKPKKRIWRYGDPPLDLSERETFEPSEPDEYPEDEYHGVEAITDHIVNPASIPLPSQPYPPAPIRTAVEMQKMHTTVYGTPLIWKSNGYPPLTLLMGDNEHDSVSHVSLRDFISDVLPRISSMRLMINIESKFYAGVLRVDNGFDHYSYAVRMSNEVWSVFEGWAHVTGVFKSDNNSHVFLLEGARDRLGGGYNKYFQSTGKPLTDYRGLNLLEYDAGLIVNRTHRYDPQRLVTGLSIYATLDGKNKFFQINKI
jgi:hypothetical protein